MKETRKKQGDLLVQEREDDPALSDGGGGQKTQVQDLC